MKTCLCNTLLLSFSVLCSAHICYNFYVHYPYYWFVGLAMYHMKNNEGPSKLWLWSTTQGTISKLSRHYSTDTLSNETIHNGRNGILTRSIGGLHEDVEFPNNIKTISRKKSLIWMRPQDMCTLPQFRISSSGSTLTPRELPEPIGPGDPNLLAAIGCLSQFPQLLERVVPPGQTFDGASGYNGLFRFNFWQWGRWVEIRIDDRLPTRNNRPAYMHCIQADVFWAALLEKAYAKLYGGYTFLKHGTVGRALQDLTGAVVQSVPPSAPLLGGTVPRSSILLAITALDKGTKQRRSGGLLQEHPYCVTGLARVRTRATPDSSDNSISNSPNDTNLVRLKSPWVGREFGGVWRGAWSKQSWEWNALNEHDRELLASRSQQEGEFWMSVPEFLRRFTVIWLAHIGPDDWALEPALHSRAPWRAALAVREWRTGFNAGGNHKHADTTATNPQFRIRVPSGSPGKAHIVVAVAQKYEYYRNRTNKSQPIGFAIYEIPSEMPRVTPQYVSDQVPLDFAELQNLREVVTFFALPPGDYIILPYSIQHREGKFLLRILADQHADVWEVNEDNLIIHNISPELCDERGINYRFMHKLRTRYPPEIDAVQLQQILKWTFFSLSKSIKTFTSSLIGPSLDLCRALLALRDPLLGGRVSIESVPSLVVLLRFWKSAFRRCGSSNLRTLSLTRSVWKSKICSYCLRGLLWAGGATASNKVLEALVSRFARGKQITFEGYLMSMAKLHLAHERFHSLDAKAKANALTLEEMILMTIYS